ncbi:MAG: response regulator [Anaeromyxobacteraceae bacterium]
MAPAEPDLVARVRAWRTAAVRELLFLLAGLAALLTIAYLPFYRDVRPFVFGLTIGATVAYALGARLPNLSYRARAIILVAPTLTSAIAVYLARGVDPIATANAFASAVLGTLAGGPIVGAAIAATIATSVVAVAISGPLAGPLPVIAPAELAFLHVLGSVPLLVVSVHGVAIVLQRLEGVSLDSIALVARLRREAEERERAVAALRESEDRFRLAFRTSQDAFSISRVDDSTFLAVSDGFTRVYGWTEQETVGKKALELGLWVDPADRARMATLLASEGEFRDLEVLQRRKDGALRTVRMSGSLFVGKDGTGQVLAVLRDVTDELRLAVERKRLHEQFAQAQKIEAIGRLAGGVAHEFNNVLTSIGASAGFIGMEAEPGSELADIAREIEAGVERGTQLTRQMLAFTQRQVLQPRPVDVNAILGDMRRVLERVLGEGIQIVLEPARETCRVLADPGQLQQAMLNLVVNARDAMPKGGRILLATSLAKGPPAEVVIEVVDEGPGIPPEIAEHLFEPFYSTKADGTGLGLASVYGIVKQHRGTIEVEPGVGRGATFRIRLPAVAEVDPAEVGMPGLPPRGHGEQVLLVDDEAVVRRATERLLARLGYHVTVASSGDEALALVEGGAKVDVVVTDVAMPGMSGTELAQQVRDRRPGTPVLFVSGYAEELMDPGLPDGGKLGFLPKPFSMETLAEKVRDLLVDA